jgi:hypothetical protein
VLICFFSVESNFIMHLLIRAWFARQSNEGGSIDVVHGRFTKDTENLGRSSRAGGIWQSGESSKVPNFGEAISGGRQEETFVLRKTQFIDHAVMAIKLCKEYGAFLTKVCLELE